MDNRVFNVNGPMRERLSDFLTEAIDLAMKQCRADTVVGWEFVREHGVLLFSYGDCKNKFLAPLGADAVASMLRAWLVTEEARSMPHEGVDADADHDGSNGPGWRAYVESWGQVANRYGVICAVRPAFMWYGK